MTATLSNDRRAGLAARAAVSTRWLPLSLAVIAGMVDLSSFVSLGGVFTAHITGNLVVLAAQVVAGQPTMISYTLSVPVFMLVLFLTRLLAGGLERAALDTLGPLLLLQLLSLAVFLVLCVTAGPWIDPNAAAAIFAGMFGVAAMAVQNALVQISLQGAPSTAAMTSNVTRFTMDLGAMLLGRDPDEVVQARSRAQHTWPAIVGFTVGCGLGAACEAAVGLWSSALFAGLALLALVMGVAATLDGGRP